MTSFFGSHCSLYLYVVPSGIWAKTVIKSSTVVGMYQSTPSIDDLIFLMALDPLQLFGHFLKSSISWTSVFVIDLKASKMGLYPVHRQRFPSKISSTSWTVVLLPLLDSSKLKKVSLFITTFLKIPRTRAILVIRTNQPSPIFHTKLAFLRGF